MPLILQALRPTGLAALRELGAGACLLLASCVAAPSGPQPSISQLTPAAMCSDQAAQINLSGHNFAPTQASSGQALRLPSVHLLRLGTPDQVTLDGTTSQALRWTSASQMTLDLAAQALRAGVWQVQVQNPGGDLAMAPTPLWVQGAPTLDSIAGDDGCANAPHDRLFTVSGSNFVIQGGTPPVVQLDGQALMPTWDASGCTQPTGDQQLAVCSRLKITVPAGFAAGSHTLTVQNPAQSTACSNAPASSGLEIAGVVPMVSHPTAPGSVSMCAGGGALAINGNFLSAHASVRIGGSAAPLITGSSCVANVDSCGTIVANFGAITAPSPAPLTVQNPGTCAVQMDAVVNVLPGPQLYAVDPPVVYDDMPNSLTLYLHGITGAINTVTASAPGSATALTLCGGGGSSPACTAQALQSAVAGDQALALTLPAGSLVSLAGSARQAAVTLEVRVAESTCSALLPAGLLVANGQTDVPLGLSPATAQVGSHRVITVTTADPRIAPGARLYYHSASVRGAFTQAAVVDARTLTAVVPQVALSGAFADVDVVLVNPDGTIYVQPQGLRLIAAAMPTLGDTNGASVSAKGGTLTTQGANLDANSTAALVNCSDKTGQAQPPVPLGLTQSNGTLTLTVPAVPVAPQRCQLLVTRASDGAQTQGGSVFLSDDIQSLPTTRDGQQPLRVARRGHGLAATLSDANLHSIVVAGGDNGQLPLTSVEIAPITASGALGPWVLSPYPLRTARTNLSLLRVGNTTVYAIGGADAAGNGVTTVERAVVLNANDAPTDLQVTAFAYGAANRQGLAVGAWSYAVALLYTSADALYPCGESLPTAPITVSAPSVPSGYIPTLAWSLPSGARPLRGVRVYRSTANGGTATLRYLTDIVSDGNAVFTDASGQGQAPAAMCAPAAADQVPLAAGALSPWTQLAAQLTRPRVGGSFAVATHSSSRTSHLLALGGLNNGAPLQDYEVMNLTAVDGTTADQWEMAQTFTAAALPNVGGAPCAGATARIQATAVVLNNGNSSRDGVTFAVTDESQYLVLGPGLGTVGVPAADGWLVGTNGQLQDVGAHVCLSSQAAAQQSVGFAVRGQIAWFGGSVAPTGVRTTAWDINGGTLRLASPESDNGTALVAPRRQAAGVSHGGYLYMTGGAATPLPQGSVEYGMW